MMPTTLTWSIAGLGLAVVLFASARADEARVLEGRTFARVSVTVDPDADGTIVVPSPFAVLPDGDRVAIHVPEAAGILLLEGERILHHFPVASGVVHDLDASPDLLVAGRRHASGSFTVTLDVFDLETGRLIEHLASANPFLRLGLEGEALWRTVIGEAKVGVYHPPAGASYPLWRRDGETVASADQMALASAGIGFGGDGAWIPHTDGSVARRQRGRTVVFSSSDRGDFLDAVADDEILFLAREATVRSDADGDYLLPEHLHVHLVDEASDARDVRLDSIGVAVNATRLVFHGRPVRVRGDRLYWIFLGRDFLEIRTARVAELGG